MGTTESQPSVMSQPPVLTILLSNFPVSSFISPTAPFHHTSPLLCFPDNFLCSSPSEDTHDQLTDIERHFSVGWSNEEIIVFSLVFCFTDLRSEINHPSIPYLISQAKAGVLVKALRMVGCGGHHLRRYIYSCEGYQQRLISELPRCI